MKVTNPNPSINSVEVEISTNELQMLETALSFSLRSLNQKDIETFFGENLEINDLIFDVRNALREHEKSQPELPPKEQLRSLVTKFKKWISDNYSEEQIKDNLIDDAGYPDWGEIENHFAKILKNNWLSILDKDDKINLLYLIARNWDIGSLIGWFSAEKPLSTLGDLSDEDFVELAKIVSQLQQPEFEEAKFQFASSFKKFDELSPEIEETLLTIYQSRDEYSRRHALISLAKLGYKNIRELLNKSWETEEEEHHKIDCLRAINEYVKDEDLLNEYLIKATFDGREEISKYVAEIKSQKNFTF